MAGCFVKSITGVPYNRVNDNDKQRKQIKHADEPEVVELLEKVHH